ncbi:MULTISPECIES: surface-adhesin E family protein [unclassified Polynucleobacter]|uniref:surface-adhesin E family protein n=1 Tax=unclassified Polynucleobacter TaxID=2640945 RepID=UPI001BFE179C|nr:MULTISPECIES: surface-adhesin E family protein [unclassified Polynucleobacter]MEA9603769.1 surface-adhesin E family protein [Polynucleobacter sp. JS-JIR-II-c23]QWE01747.1 hypothetical protein ICV90_06025 [Polynucleobacter sp. JS-JIR-II-b4]
MKSITTLLAISATLLTSGNVMAAWQEIGTVDSFTVFVDPATIQKQDDKTQILSMLDFKKPGQNPQTKEIVNSIIGLNEFDCSTAKYRPIEFKAFAGNGGKGKVVEEQKTPDSPFEAIENKTWAAGVFNVACRSK